MRNLGLISGHISSSWKIALTLKKKVINLNLWKLAALEISYSWHEKTASGKVIASEWEGHLNRRINMIDVYLIIILEFFCTNSCHPRIPAHYLINIWLQIDLPFQVCAHRPAQRGQDPEHAFPVVAAHALGGWGGPVGRGWDRHWVIWSPQWLPGWLWGRLFKH